MNYFYEILAPLRHWWHRHAKRMKFLFVLICLGLILVWFDQRRELLMPQDFFNNKVDRIDFYAEQVDLRRFDQNGRLFQHLVSPQISHVEKTDITYVNEPQLHILDHRLRLWLITAQSAEISDSNNIIKFYHQAKARQNEQHWQVSSEMFAYDQAKQQVWSDYATTFQQKDTVIHGSGFVADLNTNRLILNGPVDSTIIKQ